MQHTILIYGTILGCKIWGETCYVTLYKELKFQTYSTSIISICLWIVDNVL